MSGRQVEERSIAALVHGRYLLASQEASTDAPLLLGFHGYAENAERSLEQMRQIPGAEGWSLCAVQALHPFYNRANEVVANWMTRMDRERAISDNLRFVGSVLAEVRAALPGCERWAFVGFSQGGAMAYRAASISPPGARGIVVLGSDLPPEIAPAALSALPPILIARGDREDWYDDKKMERDLERLRASGAQVQQLIFQGGHEWTEEFRAGAGAFLSGCFAR